MRTTLIVGIILAAASGSALAQGFGTPPKPSVAAKPPQAAVKPASTPESRSAAALSAPPPMKPTLGWITERRELKAASGVGDLMSLRLWCTALSPMTSASLSKPGLSLIAVP